MPLALLAACLLCVAVAVGCGSEDDLSAFPPAAVPAAAPALEAAPEGRVVRVGARAEGVAVDGATGLVAVAVREPAELVLLDAVTLAERRRIPLPGPARHVVRTRPGGPLLVPVDGTAKVVEVALPSARARTLTAAAPVHDVLRAPAGLLAGDAIDRIPRGPVARLDARARRVTLLDARTGRTLAREPAGVGPASLVAGDEGRVFVADADGGAVLLVRTEPELRLARRYGLPGTPYGTAIDRERGKLWVTLTATNEVVQLTADGAPREQRRYRTVRQPNTVAVDAASGRVYVAGAADGTLQAFDGYAQAP